MITTFDLIENYAKTQLNNSLNKKEFSTLGIIDYNINGSVIKINYSYQYDWSDDITDRDYKVLEVELLDYITFVFNSFSAKL